MTNKTIPSHGVMLDLETLGLGPNAVVTQVAMLVYRLDDPSTITREIVEYLPIQPQLALSSPRTVDGDTIIWWMSQSDEARARFERSAGNDMDELLALVRAVGRKFREATRGIDYEIWAKGPQFDVVKMETLFTDCGQEIPWTYDSVRDLRTVMKVAGVSTADVESVGLVPHMARDDCRYQIRCYEEAFTRLHAKG